MILFTVFQSQGVSNLVNCNLNIKHYHIDDSDTFDNNDYNHDHYMITSEHLDDISPPLRSQGPVFIIVKMDVTGPGALVVIISSLPSSSLK